MSLPDPHDDLRRQFREIQASIPRGGPKRVYTASLEPLLEHVEARSGRRALPYRDQAIPAHLTGLPLILDETVEPGWLELRQGDTVVDRVRIA